MFYTSAGRQPSALCKKDVQHCLLVMFATYVSPFHAGIKFKPFSAVRKPYNRLSPAGRGGCYNYRALPSDYVSRVAYVFGSTPQQVLLDNKASYWAVDCGQLCCAV
jgi:hypothetical protein